MADIRGFQSEVPLSSHTLLALDRGSAALSATIGRALEVLLQARAYALKANVSVWEFAVELRTFTAMGLTSNDLRYLIHEGLVLHGREVTDASASSRVFELLVNYTLPEQTCFAITDRGLAFAQRVGLTGKALPRANGAAPFERFPPEDSVPSWDARGRELRLGAAVIKRFRQPAARQETILSAFEEEGWPYRIDDPLPPQCGRSSRRHLHDTINNLNRYQQQRLIQFVGDGLGEGVCWRLLQQSNTTATPVSPMVDVAPEV